MNPFHPSLAPSPPAGIAHRGVFLVLSLSSPPGGGAAEEEVCATRGLKKKRERQGWWTGWWFRPKGWVFFSSSAGFFRPRVFGSGVQDK